MNDVDLPRHREQKASSHLVEMTPNLLDADVFRVPCESHLGRIEGQDQWRFLPLIKRCQLTLVPRFACVFASPARIAFESRVLIFAAVLSWRKRKKIKIFLTHFASKMSTRRDDAPMTTSRISLKLLEHLCHATDTTAVRAD
ncbi:hypothetical protein [Sinorhizobium fredii]|uniref:hypothetical protein n=1 Tax=Rhizobium fredii TaxID=380 RepID=UPI00117D14E3|nr:hypothetical protein [Sinorhizobium fredii]